MGQCHSWCGISGAPLEMTFLPCAAWGVPSTQSVPLPSPPNPILVQFSITNTLHRKYFLCSTSVVWFFAFSRIHRVHFLCSMWHSPGFGFRMGMLWTTQMVWWLVGRAFPPPALCSVPQNSLCFQLCQSGDGTIILLLITVSYLAENLSIYSAPEGHHCPHGAPRP